MIGLVESGGGVSESHSGSDRACGHPRRGGSPRSGMRGKLLENTSREHLCRSLPLGVIENGGWWSYWREMQSRAVSLGTSMGTALLWELEGQQWEENLGLVPSQVFRGHQVGAALVGEARASHLMPA